MTVYSVEPDLRPLHRSFRLTRPRAGGAAASHVRPALVLPERQARALLAAAERCDVARGGCYAAGPAGVQVWSGPWDGVLGTHGSSEHLGSVDWCYDTPNRHYITVYRVMVTRSGAEAGVSTSALLEQVLAMAGLEPVDEGDLVPAPARDPFRR